MSLNQTLYQGTIKHAYYANSLQSICIEISPRNNTYLTLLLPCAEEDQHTKSKLFDDKSVEWHFVCEDNVIVKSHSVDNTTHIHCTIQ